MDSLGLLLLTDWSLRVKGREGSDLDDEWKQRRINPEFVGEMARKNGEDSRGTQIARITRRLPFASRNFMCIYRSADPIIKATGMLLREQIIQRDERGWKTK